MTSSKGAASLVGCDRNVFFLFFVVVVVVFLNDL